MTRCACGTPFTVYLEQRSYIRKEAAIAGAFRGAGDLSDRPMTVLNLSRTGLFFEVEGDLSLEVGAVLQVSFSFGNRSLTHVAKEATIRRLEGCRVAVEFTVKSRAAPLDPAYDLALAQFDPSGGSPQSAPEP